MRAMILAAGLGNRMRPLTDHTPKPLLCAGGKPLIEYHLENLQRAGIQEIIINLAYLGEKIHARLGDGEQWNLRIRYSQEPEPLETGGAILRAGDLLGSDPFLLINADVWCDLEFAAFVADAMAPQQLGKLLLMGNPPFHPAGDFALGNGDILVSDPEKTHPRRFTFAGVSLLKPELVTTYPERREKFPLAEACRYAIKQQKLCGQLHHGYWSDVGTPARFSELESYLASRSLG